MLAYMYVKNCLFDFVANLVKWHNSLRFDECPCSVMDKYLPKGWGRLLLITWCRRVFRRSASTSLFLDEDAMPHDAFLSYRWLISSVHQESAFAGA